MNDHDDTDAYANSLSDMLVLSRLQLLGLELLRDTDNYRVLSPTEHANAVHGLHDFLRAVGDGLRPASRSFSTHMHQRELGILLGSTHPYQEALERTQQEQQR